MASAVVSDGTSGPAVSRVVTISASYGAGGSVIAPQLAERLGLPFLDRLLSPQAAHEAGNAGERLTKGEEAATPASRIFAYLAHAAGVGTVMAAPPGLIIDDDHQIRRRAEADIAQLCSGGGGVLLGRAGAVVLAERPRTFHVRLDGPQARRIRRAATDIEKVPESEAATRCAETDRARLLYVRRLYRADPTDSTLYHLVLDTTVMRLDRAVDVVAGAATAFWENNP